MMDWLELEEACLDCRACALAETRHNVVFGVGPRNAEVLMVGEGPGEQEDLCWPSSAWTGGTMSTSPTS